jgi:hypothetical protein
MQLAVTMSFKPKLTAAELREIWDRNRSRDVWLLLWEIRRLHALVRRGHQLQSMLSASDKAGMVGTIVRAFQIELADEPCLAEKKKLVTPERELKREARKRRNA